MSYNNGPRIVTNGLVLHLDAGNSRSYPVSGTSWVDLSRNGYNGQLINGTTFSSSNGGELVFDGVNDYVNVASMYNFATTNQLTAIVWAKSSPATWNDYGFLASKRNQFIMHPTISSREVAYYMRTNAGWENRNVTPSNIQIYNQYCMTYNAGAFVAYLNGLSVTSANLNATMASDTGDLSIGKDEDHSRYLNGSITIAQFYNRALTAAEVRQNYHATKGRFGL
jgi:hypothetical protein